MNHIKNLKTEVEKLEKEKEVNYWKYSNIIWLYYFSDNIWRNFWITQENKEYKFRRFS